MNDAKSSEPKLADIKVKRFPKRVAVGVIVMAFIIGGCVAAYQLIWVNSVDAPPVTDTPQQQASKAAEYQTVRGEYDKAVQELMDFIATNPSKLDKEAAMIQLGTIYLNAKKSTEATKWFDEVEKSIGAVTADTARGKALAAEMAGDTATAITQYQRFVDIMKTDPSKYFPGDIPFYEQKIKAMQGGA